MRPATNILWQIYLCWLQNCAGIHKRNVFRLGKKWTARSVIVETHKAELTHVRKEMVDGSNDIKFYQLAFTELINSLSADEMRKAEQTAVEWNCSSSPDKAQERYLSALQLMSESGLTAWNTNRFANKNSPKLIQQFTNQMWRKGGIRFDGEIFSQKCVVRCMPGMTLMSNFPMAHPLTTWILSSRSGMIILSQYWRSGRQRNHQLMILRGQEALKAKWWSQSWRPMTSSLTWWPTQRAEFGSQISPMQAAESCKA